MVKEKPFSSPTSTQEDDQGEVASNDGSDDNLTTKVIAQREKLLFKGGISYQGPLPHPSDFEGYEKVLSGAAERILALAEKQAAHRQEMEKGTLSIESRNSKWGLFFGYSIAIIGLVIGGYLVLPGHDAAGAAIAGIPLTYLVAVFVTGYRERAKMREVEAGQTNAEAEPPNS